MTKFANRLVSGSANPSKFSVALPALKALAGRYDRAFFPIAPFLLLVILLATVVACGEATDSPSPEGPTERPTTQPEPTSDTSRGSTISGVLQATGDMDSTVEVEPTATPMPEPTPIPTREPIRILSDALIPTAQTSVETDRQALVAFYHATNGDNWYNNSNWLTAAPLGEWHGVWTDDDGRVIGIQFRLQFFNGEMPAELGNLANLRYLDLRYNGFNGEIPAELGNLTNLEVLSFYGDGFTGEIPAELGNLTNLRFLDLAFNYLTGEIPAELGNLTNLEWLFLSENDLIGEIPAELDNLTDLKFLDLSGNNLTGEVSVAQASKATRMQVVPWIPAAKTSVETDRQALVALYHATHGDNWVNRDNWLTDAPLREWHGVETDDDGRVSDINLFKNALHGELPPELGSLTNLRNMQLFENQLTGEIPPELGNLINLEVLTIGGNRIIGEIPSELGNLTNLLGLYLSNNALTGEIPPELGNLTDLRNLELKNNSLTGELPPELGNLTNLGYMTLSGNNLTGAIPAELGSTKLRFLIFSADNQFSCAPAELQGPGGILGLADLPTC